MRNFWIQADIDGRKTLLEGGPRSKDGGFKLTIFQKVHGEAVTALVVRGYPLADNRLEVRVQANDELMTPGELPSVLYLKGKT